MIREQHNTRWNTNYQPSDSVLVMTYGAEQAQYDPRCSACWLNHSHTWDEHDRSIALRVANDEEYALNQKIAHELCWQNIHARLGKTNVNYDPTWAADGIARHGHIVDYIAAVAPRGYAWAWLNEPGIYTAKGSTAMSLGDVWREMKHNDGYEIINLDTHEVVCMKYAGMTVFYPQRNIYSIRRKDYQPGQARKYSYRFQREPKPFAPNRYDLARA